MCVIIYNIIFVSIILLLLSSLLRSRRQWAIFDCCRIAVTDCYRRWHVRARLTWRGALKYPIIRETRTVADGARRFTYPHIIYYVYIYRYIISTSGPRRCMWGGVLLSTECIFKWVCANACKYIHIYTVIGCVHIV